MAKDRFDIELAFRPLNILSKILGLSHFSLYRNPFSGEIKLGDNRESGFGNIIWCVVMMCVIFTGFIINTISVRFSSSSDVFEIITFIISMPMGYLEALLALLAGITFNRNKFSKFVLKISEIDKDLFGCKRIHVYNKQYTSCIRQVVIFPFILVPFYFYDSYIFGDEVKYLYGYMHVSSFMKQVVILQFVNVVWIIKDRLQYLKIELAKSLETPTNIFSNTQLVINTSRIGIPKHQKQISPLRAEKYEDTGVLVPDCRVFRTTHFSSPEVERLIRLRKLYNMIFHASVLINGIYGIHILLELTYNFINVVVSFYGIVGIITDSLKLNSTLTSLHYIFVYICWILVSLVNVFAISVSCHKASAEVESCSQEIQKLLIMEPLRQDTRRQLKHLSLQMSDTRIVFTAFDLFTINFSIVFTFVSSATAYVIVLVQLK
jgi:hypothetical protein